MLFGWLKLNLFLVLQLLFHELFLSLHLLLDFYDVVILHKLLLYVGLAASDDVEQEFTNGHAIKLSVEFFIVLPAELVV